MSCRPPVVPEEPSQPLCDGAVRPRTGDGQQSPVQLGVPVWKLQFDRGPSLAWPPPLSLGNDLRSWGVAARRAFKGSIREGEWTHVAGSYGILVCSGALVRQAEPLLSISFDAQARAASAASYPTPSASPCRGSDFRSPSSSSDAHANPDARSRHTTVQDCVNTVQETVQDEPVLSG